MEGIVLFGFSVSAIIVALIQVLKWLGLPDSWVQPVSIALNLAAAIVAQLVVSVPEWSPALQVVVTTIATFLTSVGLYHTGKNAGQKMGVVSKGE